MAVALRRVVGKEKPAVGFLYELDCGHVVWRDSSDVGEWLYCAQCPPRWAPTWDSCVGCGGTSRPHAGSGNCTLCRQRIVRPARQWEGGAKNRRFRVDDYVFRKWDERSAYLFGVIAADGHVGCGKYANRVQIALGKKDEDWLRQLAGLLGFTGDIGEYTVSDEHGDRAAVRFTFVSPVIADRLRTLGVKKPEAVGVVPVDVFEHFVRGYFDGDGSVFVDSQSGRLKSNFAGSCAFVTLLRDRLAAVAGLSDRMKVNPKPNSPRTASLTYAFSDTCKLGGFMYSNATVCLERKRRRFQEGGALFRT